IRENETCPDVDAKEWIGVALPRLSGTRKDVEALRGDKHQVYRAIASRKILEKIKSYHYEMERILDYNFLFDTRSTRSTGQRYESSLDRPGGNAGGLYEQ